MVTIRLGTPGDFDEAVEIWKLSNTARRAGRPLPAGHEERVRGYLGKDDMFFVVADDGASVVGMALGMQGLADDGAGPPIEGLCHISMVFVHPQRWGQGLGARLMRALMDEARTRGFARAQLWTHADNARAERLYERLGFRRSGREKPDDTGELMIHFERELDRPVAHG